MISYLLRSKEASVATADKRTVATDALETLGTVLRGGEGRDAIHLAVEPVVAGEPLRPGQDVGVHDGRAHGEWKGKTVGIVDPFLRSMVCAGQRFWLVVYPRQITSLRHVWTHPGFPEEAPRAAGPVDVPAALPGIRRLLPTEDQKQASEAWLRCFIDGSNCPDYETVLAAATGQHHLNEMPDDDYVHSSNDGEYLHFDGRDAHGEIPPEFWHHVSVVSGREIPRDERAVYFSCSC